MRNIDFWGEAPYGYEEKYNEGNNSGLPVLDFFPASEKGEHSCMLILPGGGYNHLADHEGENIAKKLNENGISAFVLYYRVFPYAFPVNFYDVKKAFSHIRKNAEKYRINKLGIMGFSAGAHLACTYTEHFDRYNDINEESFRPDALGLCYPVISFTDENIMHAGSLSCFFGDDEKRKSELAEHFSCEKNVREDMPPVFLWHSFEDKSVNCINSLVMAKSLKEKNIPFELHLFPNGRHGCDLATDIEGTKQWFDLYVNWLKRQGF